MPGHRPDDVIYFCAHCLRADFYYQKGQSCEHLTVSMRALAGEVEELLPGAAGKPWALRILQDGGILMNGRDAQLPGDDHPVLPKLIALGKRYGLRSFLQRAQGGEQQGWSFCLERPGEARALLQQQHMEATERTVQQLELGPVTAIKPLLEPAPLTPGQGADRFQAMLLRVRTAATLKDWDPAEREHLGAFFSEDDRGAMRVIHSLASMFGCDHTPLGIRTAVGELLAIAQECAMRHHP